MTARQSSGVTSSAGAWTQAPALLTRTSTRPWSGQGGVEDALDVRGDGDVGLDEVGADVVAPQRSRTPSAASASRPTRTTRRLRRRGRGRTRHPAHGSRR